MKAVARNLGLGRLKLYAFHRPIGLIRKSCKEGGPIEQWRTERQRYNMIEAARNLSVIVKPTEDFGARAHFLSGKQFWYQTVFCIVSLQMCTTFLVTPVVFDDGSLDAEVRSWIKRVVPWVEFVDAETITRRLDDFLPRPKYPALRARRDEYTHLRKLTDVHVGYDDWAIVLDSDMLFFRAPTALHDWFHFRSALFMQDIDNAYGYTADLMRELSEGQVPNRVNVGLYALDRSKIDWDVVEGWCRTQIDREQPHYLQEQALTALILGQQGATPLPAEDYLLMPSLAEGANPTAVLHHYVAHSKRSYFQHGWRHVVRKLAPGERAYVQGGCP